MQCVMARRTFNTAAPMAADVSTASRATVLVLVVSPCLPSRIPNSLQANAAVLCVPAAKVAPAVTWRLSSIAVYNCPPSNQLKEGAACPYSCVCDYGLECARDTTTCSEHLNALVACCMIAQQSVLC